MALLFEYCFYAGLLVAVVGIVWLLLTLVRRPKRNLVPPICLLLLAGLLTVGPAIITRTMAVDLGPRERIVQNERHLSLTGWDQESYAFLLTKPDTVVLQMANPSVNDTTLDLLLGMKQLRELDLNDSSITDEGLAKLAWLPALETLRLRGTRITDEGFREYLFNHPKLRQLNLQQTDVLAETIELWKSDDPSRRALQ